MRKVLLVLVVGTAFAEFDEKKFDAYYYTIRQCIEAERSEVQTVKEKEKVDEVLLKRFRPGYFLLVDTKGLTSSQACQVAFVAKKFGGEGVYMPNLGLVVVGVYPTEEDASYIKKQIESTMRGIKLYVRQIVSKGVEIRQIVSKDVEKTPSPSNNPVSHNSTNDEYADALRLLAEKIKEGNERTEKLEQDVRSLERRTIELEKRFNALIDLLQKQAKEKK